MRVEDEEVVGGVGTRRPSRWAENRKLLQDHTERQKEEQGRKDSRLPASLTVLLGVSFVHV